jgi:hypothetical protein
MIQWEMPVGNEPNPTTANKCALNHGVLDPSGNQISRPARIWVDDILKVAVGVTAMKRALAALIESIFVVLGTPNLERRQCPLTMDKWLKFVVAEHQLALGLIWNTGKMSVAIPRDYLDDTLHILSLTLSLEITLMIPSTS